MQIASIDNMQLHQRLRGPYLKFKIQLKEDSNHVVLNCYAKPFCKAEDKAKFNDFTVKSNQSPSLPGFTFWSDYLPSNIEHSIGRHCKFYNSQSRTQFKFNLV